MSNKGDSIQKSLKNNVFQMTQLGWVEESTQWVWNIHISLERWTWVYNNEYNIEKRSGNIVKKTMPK